MNLENNLSVVNVLLKSLELSSTTEETLEGATIQSQNGTVGLGLNGSSTRSVLQQSQFTKEVANLVVEDLGVWGGRIWMEFVRMRLFVDG